MRKFTVVIIMTRKDEGDHVSSFDICKIFSQMIIDDFGDVGDNIGRRIKIIVMRHNAG